MKFHKTIKIGGKSISETCPAFIIAEAGVNHNGDMKKAKELIDVAKESGVDAVKFQTFKAEHLILRNVKKAPYQLKTTDQKESQFEMLRRLEVSKEQNVELRDYCHKNKLIFLTTPFDECSLDELDVLDLPAYKIASTDTTNIPFLKRVAKKKKPIILSTGMADLKDVRKALEAIHAINKDVIILQCTANYPIKDNEVHLNVIRLFQQEFDMLIGFSDHTVGVGASPYAIAVGAKVIEKHFTLDKAQKGPDHKASLNPEELKEFVTQIRKVEEYLGASDKNLSASEVFTRKSLQKCLVASQKIQKGELFAEDNIIAKRTGGAGISPLKYEKVLGKKAKRDYQYNDIIEL